MARRHTPRGKVAVLEKMTRTAMKHYRRSCSTKDMLRMRRLGIRHGNAINKASATESLDWVKAQARRNQKLIEATTDLMLQCRRRRG